MEHWTENATFGPPSEPIRIQDFLDKSAEARKRISSIFEAFEIALMNVDEDEDRFEPIPDELKPIIEAECGYVVTLYHSDELTK